MEAKRMKNNKLAIFIILFFGFLLGATPYLTENADLVMSPKRAILTLDDEDGTTSTVTTDGSTPLPVSPAGTFHITTGYETTYNVGSGMYTVPVSRSTYDINLGANADWAILCTSANIRLRFDSTAADLVTLYSDECLNTEG